MGSVTRCRNGTATASSCVSAVGLRNVAILSYVLPLVEDIIKAFLSSMREMHAIAVAEEGSCRASLFKCMQMHLKPTTVCAAIEVL